MNESNDDTTIGRGGWFLVALAAVVTFSVLRFFLDHDLFPATVFALAIALVVFLILFRLAEAVNRSDDEEEEARVRRIVPGTSPGGGGARISGVEGARAAGARAVRVGAEAVPATPVPQPPSAVVTPLAAVAQAPLISPLPVKPTKAAAEPVVPPAEPEMPPAGPVVPLAVLARAEAAMTGADGAEKPGAVARAKPKPKATTKPWTEKPAGKAKAANVPTGPVGLVRLAAPRNGKADDLKEIEGIGPALEKLVNAMGFYHFDQIAAWTEAEVAMVEAEMKNFKGRITRDRWVAQARIIVTEGLEAFRERAKSSSY